MNIVSFEDARVSDLHPITIARPAYAINCAGFRVIDWLDRLEGKHYGWVREHLRVIQQLDFELETIHDAAELAKWDANTKTLWINARLCPSVSNWDRIGQFAELETSAVLLDPKDGSVLAAITMPADRERFLRATEGFDPAQSDGLEQVLDFLATLPADRTTDRDNGPSGQLQVFRLPHDLIRLHMQEMNHSMNARLKTGNYREVIDGVFAGENVVIGDYPVVDTSEGPIVFEDNVKVGPFCYLAGPVYAGANTRVIEHAALKDGVALGHTVKIGGEVEASIIEPYTNKQHHGFLGA